MQETIVLHPSVGVGHLNPMVALADHFLRRGLAVTVLLIEPPLSKLAFHEAIKKATANNPSISFRILPLPDSAAAAAVNTDRDTRGTTRNYLNRYNPSLLAFLQSTPSPVAVVLDIFCVAALDTTIPAGIPTYIFVTMGAGATTALLHQAHQYADVDLADLGDARVHWPGVPPFPASDFPLVSDKEGAERIKSIIRRFPYADGILVNSFESLEAVAIGALREGRCVPGRSMLPVYCVGPLVGKVEDGREGSQRHDCLAWLDAQPERSVVFLSFGSMASHTAKQIKEMAIALERAGHRFLWVLRAPKGHDWQSIMEGIRVPDLDAVLPKGFIERTKGRGFIANKWAPQVEVLNHPATGAFVTHCGWNSALEGITAGMPLLCYPMYAEQRLNKVFIVETMRVGVELKGYNKFMVPAEELEDKIRYVMESDGGRELRERVAAVRESAAAALQDGGSSSLALEQFLNDMRSRKHADGAVRTAS